MQKVSWWNCPEADSNSTPFLTTRRRTRCDTKKSVKYVCICASRDGINMYLHAISPCDLRDYRLTLSLYPIVWLDFWSITDWCLGQWTSERNRYRYQVGLPIIAPIQIRGTFTHKEEGIRVFAELIRRSRKRSILSD